MRQLAILSAGHGNGDPGAVGQGTTEAEQTVILTNRVADLLRSWGCAVDVEPHDVGDLVAEINWVNARYKGINDGLAVQIHKNSGGGHGAEVWAPSYADATSTNQAQIIANAIAAETGLPNRGVKFAQNNRWGRLGWTDDTNTYALLVEANFIDSDPLDPGTNERTAQGIAKGIMQVFGLGIPQPPAPQPEPTPDPVVTVPDAIVLPSRRTFKTLLNPTHVWNLNTKPHWSSVKELPINSEFIAYAVVNWDNSVYYITEYSYLKGLKYGVNAVDLEEVHQTPPTTDPVPEAPTTPEVPTTEPVVDVPTETEDPDEPTTPTEPSDPTPLPEQPSEPEQPKKSFIEKVIEWLIKRVNELADYLENRKKG